MSSYGAFEDTDQDQDQDQDQHLDHHLDHHAHAVHHQRYRAADATDAPARPPMQPLPSRHWRRVGAVACGVVGLTAAVSAVMGGAGGVGGVGGDRSFDSDATVAPDLSSVGSGNGDGRLKNTVDSGTSAYPAPTWHPKLRLPTLEPTAEPSQAKTHVPTGTGSPTYWPAPTPPRPTGPTTAPTVPAPTLFPTVSTGPTPTLDPTNGPTYEPTSAPTWSFPPSVTNTSEPTSSAPTPVPSPFQPTWHKKLDLPTVRPTHDPTADFPTVVPTPTPYPTATDKPTTPKPSPWQPTWHPKIAVPTATPTSPPTTPKPTLSQAPTIGPTGEPTPAPTDDNVKTAAYDFCDGFEGNPTLETEKGSWALNATYLPDWDCLAKNVDGYTSTSIVKSTYFMTNMTVNVTYIKKDTDYGQVASVALRSHPVSTASYVDWCEGHAKYVCEVAGSDVTKVALHLKVCTNDGDYAMIASSEYKPFSTENWYRISFSAIGDILTCTMQDDDPKASDYLETVVDISANTTMLGDDAIDVAGMGEFGSYSNSQLFRDFKIEDNGLF